MWVKLLKIMILSLSVLFAANTLAADFVPDITAVNPGVVGNRLQPQKFPLPGASAPLKTVTKAPPASAFPGAEKIRFKLTQVTLEGNTVYSNAELESLFQSSLNKEISLADLQAIVDSITTKYRSAGYVLSRAILPPQEIKGGAVRVQIIEGFISTLTVTGNPGRAKSIIKKFGKHVVGIKPFQVSMLEHYMLLANDLPGITVRSVLTPSKDIPGAAELNMVVERVRGGFSANYNNYGTRYIGPQQTTFSGSLYSLIAPGDNNNIQYSRTPVAKQLKFIALTHSQPIGSKGANIAVGWNYTKTQAGFILKPLEIVGRSTTYFADVTYPYIRSRNKNLIFHALANYQNVFSNLLMTIPFYRDRIRSLTVGASFDKIDSWRGINTVVFDIEHGFPIMGARDHFLQSRPNGQTPYTKYNLTLSRLQALGSRFTLLGAVHGQKTQNILLATEQFGFGGSDYGRGYDPSEIVGDQGVAGKFEFRMDTNPGFRLLQSVQYYLFYDAGIIWNHDAVNLPAKQTATSTGVGARFAFMPHLMGSFYLAKPLTYPVATQVALGEDGNAFRSFFQIQLDY